MDRDDELINEIAPDVLGVLARKRFFEALDDQMCPADPAQPCLSCEGTYAISTAILMTSGFDQDAIDDIVQVLALRGGCCDCEILFNVADGTRLKSEYWRARAVRTSSSSRGRHPGV
jgi:hypothetical protein